MEKLWIDSCSLEELGRLSGATVKGTADPIRALAPIGAAGPGDLTLLANRRYAREARSSPASAILTSDALAGQLGDRPLLVASNPLLGFVTLMRHFAPPHSGSPGWGDAATLLDSTTSCAPSAVIAPSAFVGPGARIGAHTFIGPMAVVEADVIIGSHCTIGPGAFIGRGCRIEDQVIVHPGAVVGSDGFGYVFDGKGHLKIPQLGNVVLERDVEIGANATIDRATLGTTRIGRGTKIDNQVQIAHNVQVGQLCVVAAQTGIAGSAKLGDRCTLGGQVGVADHVFVGEHVVAAARTGFSCDVVGGTWAGVPAQPIERWRRTIATLDWLVDVRRQIVKLLRLGRDRRASD